MIRMATKIVVVTMLQIGISFFSWCVSDADMAWAERVVDKCRSNFCDYFVFIDDAARKGQSAKKDEARSKLDDLFKK